MRKARVAINGFGRIGRALYRINQERQLFDVVAINEPQGDAVSLAYLLQYDSVYGTLASTVRVDNGHLSCDAQYSRLYRATDAAQLDWRNLDLDCIVDCSGHAGGLDALRQHCPMVLVTRAALEHENMPTWVLGANVQLATGLSPSGPCCGGQGSGPVNGCLSTSICDTVALAPLLAVLAQFGVLDGTLTTLHPWLSYQSLTDGWPPTEVVTDMAGGHLGLGRAAMGNLIPKSTSAIRAAEPLFPGITERVAAFSYRVPTPVVSSAVLTLRVAEPVSKSLLEQELFRRAETDLAGILAVNLAPRVSCDYRAAPHSLVVDHRWTEVAQEGLLRLVYWYDNEWGYTSRVAELVQRVMEDSRSYSPRWR